LQKSELVFNYFHFFSLYSELYANPNEYVNPNDRKKPPPKSNTYEEFDPDDDPDLQEAILQSKYK